MNRRRVCVELLAVLLLWTTILRKVLRQLPVGFAIGFECGVIIRLYMHQASENGVVLEILWTVTRQRGAQVSVEVPQQRGKPTVTRNMHLPCVQSCTHKLLNENGG